MESEEVLVIRKAKTLLDVDVCGVLEAVEAKYGVKLPRRVVTVDYGGDVGDLFVKFKHAEPQTKP